MNKAFECVLVMIMGVGPVAMFVILTESYGRYGLISALIMCGIYLALVVTAVILRCCLRRWNPDPEAQQADDSDLPPSYEDVTAKPPPYSFLFASAPPNGDDWPSRHNYGGYTPVHALTLTCPVPGDLHAAPPSYIEAVSGVGSSSGTSSCVTVSESASCDTVLSRFSSNNNISSSQSINDTRSPSPATTPPATATTTAGGLSCSGNPLPATRVFIIPLPGPSPFPHRCAEAIPLLPT